MKKLVALLVFSLGILLFVSCTDNSLEDIEKYEKKHVNFDDIQFIDTGNDGNKEKDEEETGD